MAIDKFGGRSGRGGYRKIQSTARGEDRYRPITCDLTREQKQAARTDFEQTGLDLGELTDCLATGYKLSVTPTNESRTFIATLTDKDPGSEYEGRWLSIRAGDPIEAIFRVLWITGTLCNGDWSILEQLAEETGDDW